MNSRIILQVTATLLSLAVVAHSESPVKIACIGASITAGALLENPEMNSYPAQLQHLIGNTFQVTNFGESSCTLLRRGDHPYWNTTKYKQVLADKPDIVFIDLGGNDSKLVNRIYLHEFEKDYRDFIQSFKTLPTHPRIILLLPIVSFVPDSTQIWNPVILNKIIPKIRRVAYDEGVEVIDVYSLFINRPQLLPDNIHPNLEGTTMIAKRLSEIILQQCDHDFHIFSRLNFSSQKTSSFYGYDCVDFDLKGHSCKIVKPKRVAINHPWIWRARFWGHEPQADIVLLERGFCLVYCDVSELFGNDKAVRIWNEFYSRMINAGLSRKVALEGMSRGAIYVYAWAVENPDKVACVYVDNPVLDLMSWPGSQYRTSAASKNEWEIFKKDFQYTSDEEALKFRGSPMYKVEQIVRGRYPMLIVCADEDEDVPPSENTIPFEQKVRAFHGNITVIHKPGFKHHPHSLPDPTPIADFILKAVNSQ